MKSWTTSLVSCLLMLLLSSRLVLGAVKTTTTTTTASTTSTLTRQQQRLWRALQDGGDGDGGDNYYDEYYDEAEYEPWQNGTPVYAQFQDTWWEGVITGFEDGSYEVTWSDDSVEDFDDFDQVDQMVYDYADNFRDHDDGDCSDDAWPDETSVYVYEDDQAWWGKVTHCQDGVYTTTWDNGGVDYYDEGPDFDQMVKDAQARKNNGDDTDNFDASTAAHDFTTQSYDEGTAVYREFDDGWYQGTIESFQDGTYTVLWEDDTRDEYPEGDELDQMVADAAQLLADDDAEDDEDASVEPGANLRPATTNDGNDDDDGRSGAAKFGIFLLIVGIAVGGAVGYLRIQKKKKQQKAAAADVTADTDLEFKDVDVDQREIA